MSTSRTVLSALILTVLIAGTAYFFTSVSSVEASSIDSATTSDNADDAGSPASTTQAPHTDATDETRRQTAGVAWGAERGKSFSYELKSSSTFALVDDSKSSDTSGDTGLLSFGGTIHWTVHDRDEESILTMLRATEFSFKNIDDDGDGIRQRIAAIKGGTFFRMDRDGRVSGIRFANETSADVRDFVRNIVSLLAYRIGAPEGGGYRQEKTWESEEFDATGVYTARYTRQADGSDTKYKAQRTKLKYVKVNAAIGEVPPHKVDGKTSIAMSRTELWLESATIDDSVAMKTPGMDATFRVGTKASVRLIEVTRVDDSELKSLSSLPLTDFVAAGGDAASGTLTPRDRLEILREQLKGKTLQDMINALRDAVAKGDPTSEELYQAWAQLGEYLEIHPKACSEILVLLQTGEAASELGQLLTSALGAAGNTEAQEALMTVASDANLNVAAREGAIVSSHQLAKPENSFVEKLDQHIERSGDFNSFKSTSLLALGTLSVRNTKQLASGKTALQLLLAKEPQAEREGWLDTWLEAVGNNKTSLVFDTVARFCKHVDEGLRGIASRVLARIDDKRVVPFLIARTKIETSAKVRQALVDSLGEAPRGAADAALRALTNDGTVAVALRAIGHIGRRVDDAANLRFVKEVAANALNKDLREAAAKILKDLAEAKKNEK